VARALILAGTGAVGRAVALRLLDAGWHVEVTGRDPLHANTEVTRRGGVFLASDRHDPAQLSAVVGDGADLLVDCACFNAEHARQLASVLGGVTSPVMLSSKAVYVDDRGRHVNSAEPPRFDSPIPESQPTMAPGAGNYDLPEGYGANKVAAEQVLLGSGYPVSVLRPSKIHGVDARRPREWYFVRRVLDGRARVFFDGDARAGDHPTAATNLAALIEVVAANPGRRILNIADPDSPGEREIARAVARHFDHDWEEVVVEGAGRLGRSPWHVVPPVVLETSAARAIGYEAVGDYSTTVAATLDWLASLGARDGTARLTAPRDDDFFVGMFDYAAEDALVDS
jgi:nucleoside-diphosphate-sugar epimerase